MHFKNFFLYAALLLSIAVFFLTSACNTNGGLSDDSTKEAKVEEGLMALDESNYAKAERLFSSLIKEYPSDNKIKGYYSSAAAGLAGLDTFNLMKTLDNLEDADKEDDTLELVGRTLTGKTDSEDPVIGKSDATLKKDNFEKALDALLQITGKTYEDFINPITIASKNIQSASLEDEDIKKLNDDELVQLGLIALNHGVIIIADIIMEDLNISQMILSEDGVKDLFKNSDLDLDNLTSYINDNNLLERLSFDIELINNSITAITRFLNITPGEDNDIKDQFEEFKNSINPDGDQEITASELEAYINKL